MNDILKSIKIALKKHIYTILLIIILIIVSLILYYRLNISIGNILAIDAILVAFFFALTQDIQLNKLKDIGIQTQKTTEKLETDSKTNKIVTSFFDIKNKDKKFKIFFPVEHKLKPLPLINQGDFYAIHVVKTRLGDRVDLQQVTEDYKDYEDKNPLEGNNIFLLRTSCKSCFK